MDENENASRLLLEAMAEADPSTLSRLREMLDESAHREHVVDDFSSQIIDIAKTAVLVFREVDTEDGAHLVDGLLSAWRDRGLSPAEMPMLVFLRAGQTVEALDDEDMRRCGWVRA